MFHDKRYSRRPARRGTIIVLAIGLLVIVAMLGSTFLVVAHLNAKQSASLARKSAADPVLGGIVENLRTTLMNDLYVGSGAVPAAPYAAAFDTNNVAADRPWPAANGAWTGPRAWQAFADIPRQPIGVADPADNFLADDWLSEPATYVDMDGDGVFRPTLPPATSDYAWFARLGTTLPTTFSPWNPTGVPVVFIKESLNGVDEYVAYSATALPARIPYQAGSGFSGVDTTGDDVADWYVGTDTDGDGFGDSLLYDTGVTNEQGEKYYAAVRVVDLGGLINVNTAGTAAPLLSPVAPFNVDLAGMQMPEGALWTTLATKNAYAPLNTMPVPAQGRYPVAAMTAQQYQDTVGNRLLQPALPAAPTGMPFAVGDEMFLRWLAPLHQGSAPEIALHPPTAAGRVYEWARSQVVPGGMTWAQVEYIRPKLTTFNCSRSITRRPASGSPRVNLSDIAAFGAVGDAARLSLYTKLVEAGLDPVQLTLAGDPNPNKAAHFVANLWAYAAGDPAFNTDAFAFDPPGAAPEVFGVVPQLVIAEAYAYALPQTDPGDPTALPTPIPPSADHGWAYAVELYNPTDYPINTTNYELRASSGAIWNLGMNGILSVAAHTRVMLFTFGEQVDDGSGTGTRRPAVAGDFNFPDPALAPWYQWNSLDFAGGNGVELVRTVGGKTIAMDTVSGADFGFNVADVQTAPAEVCQNGLRDDSALNRAILSEYDVKNLLATGRTFHKLGAADNGVAAGDLPAVWKGFDIKVTANPGLPVSSVGESLAVYLTGPGAGLNLPKQLSLLYKSDISRGRPDVRGAVAVVLPPNQHYPDVPWATLLSEMVEVLTPDTTRVSDSGGVATRIYGRINLNTATQEVLERLPWPATLTWDGGSRAINAPERAIIAKYIIAYRDRAALGLPHSYADMTGLFPPGEARAKQLGSNIPGLRGGAIAGVNRPLSDVKGYLTPGELAIPLADCANFLMNWNGYTSPAPAGLVEGSGYLAARDSLYKAVSNLVTVNSDVYAAYITVQLRSAGPVERVRQNWRYIAVLDRSSCTTGGETPAVLLLSQVK